MGDEQFEDSGAGELSTGRGTLTGGTGKFAGIRGEYDIEIAFVASPRDGLFQGIGHKKGNWRIATE